ncbi:Acetyl-hydrolase [Penicillium ucsense]|uniref:Acetyl-hydrolase n=1 Tax=Penicillium ucsense TaxID=2839758 RepID=A0A8J8W389_9EURO|nr:Acetyl-hydrolase [Penicillium ucsense]KAF7733965.1 Acetyl-hydrolase [Penicillium ucsense]
MSDYKYSAHLLKELIIRIPLILKTLLLHGIQMSPGTGKQDLRTELTTAMIRSFMTFSAPVDKTQKNSMRDPGVKGPMWVSKVTLPRPEFDVRDAVVRAIEDLKTTGNETFALPPVAEVEAEWTGFRSGVGKKTPQPDLSEEEKYQQLRRESTSDMTILYFHGGAYFLMDPCTHRVPVAHLSRLTGAPVLSVRYRLAPQNPFPAALVDALTAYLSLIHPPPGSLHKPVPANKIIIAGDSAGGNLSLVLLKTLLTLKRAPRPVRFHGQDVDIELPGGVALISPWCDLTHSMPSIVNNLKFDYLDMKGTPSEDPEEPTAISPAPFPPGSVWPVDPPRLNMFTDANMMLHPLVSPMAAKPELWEGAPPVLISTGEELLTDESFVVARRMHQAGVNVVVDQFEGMPHCHAMIMMSTATGKQFFKNVAGFCLDAAAGRVKSTGQVHWYGQGLKTSREIPLAEVVDLDEDRVDARMSKSASWLVRDEEALRKEWRAQAKL